MLTIWNDLLNLFYPALCELCESSLLKGEERICLECLCDLPRAGFHAETENPVASLFTGKIAIKYATAFLYYEKGGKTQRLIHALKYHDNKELGNILGRQAARDLLSRDSRLCQADLLLPVPLHPAKEKKRGYNQSERIAAGISATLNIPFRTDCISRIEQTDTQTHRSVYDRWENVRTVFAITNPEPLRNKHVILIDDVITTGATIAACAEALQGIPGIRISVLALSVA